MVRRAMLYLDHAATTPPLPEALEAFARAARDAYANPGSLHGLGAQAARALEEARGELKRAMGARRYRVVLTATGTEANDLGIRGLARAVKSKVERASGKPARVLVSSIEHPCSLLPARALAEEGFVVEEIAPDAAGVVRVEIEYTTPFDVNLAGLFKVEEQGNAYALAKSESIQARRFMPGFDEPRSKAPFDIALTVPANDTAISNTPVVSREPVDEGALETWTFERTRPLPAYLLSLAVGNFDKVEAEPLAPNDVRSVPIPLTGYTREGKGEEITYALDMTEPMVAFFERELPSFFNRHAMRCLDETKFTEGDLTPIEEVPGGKVDHEKFGARERQKPLQRPLVERGSTHRFELRERRR
mgnify:CR=1 FL=1